MTGKRIREARIRLGIMPKRLAEMLDITVDELRAYEKELIPVDAETLISFCDALRTTPDRLTGYAKGSGIRTRLDELPAGGRCLTVYLEGWQCITVDYTGAGDMRLTFEEVEE